MKRINIFWLQHKLVYCFIAVAILLFVAGLGFMTNFYPMFYDGTSEMYDYYKGIQVFNRVLFRAAVVFVIMGLLLLGFDINKKENGIFGVAYVIGITVYAYLTIGVILRAIPYYQKLYEAFDFSSMELYEPSTTMFYVSKYISVALLCILVLLALIVSVRFIHSFFTNTKEVPHE